MTHSSRVPRLPSLIVSCSRNETHGFPTHVTLGIHACHLTPNDPATRGAQRSTLARLLCVACCRACLVYALPDKRRMLLQGGGQCALPGPGRPHQNDSDRPGVAIPRRRRRRWLPICGSLAALVPVCVSTVAFPTCPASMCCMLSSIVPQDQQMIKASHRFSAGSLCSGAGCIAGSAANMAWPSAAAGALAAFVGVTAGCAAASVAAAAEVDSAEAPSLRI